MKTEPFAHQLVGRRRLDENPDFFALGAEQGTGKTWMLLDNAERQFEAGRIGGLLVVAPNGVHVNWVRIEIPKHVSVPVRTEFWVSGMSKKKKAAVDGLLSPMPEEERTLVVLAMNFEALTTKNGFEFAERFLRRRPGMIVVDESHKIKNPTSARTNKLTQRLAPLAKSRRIASGTLIADKPLDLFGQFQFLRSGLLGTTSYRSFVAEYAEVLPPHHPLIRNLAKKTHKTALDEFRAGLAGRAAEYMSRLRAQGVPDDEITRRCDEKIDIEVEKELTRLMETSKKSAQIINRDSDGNAVYKNLQKLGRLIAPYTYRVLKEDCLDLPPKIYTTHFYALPPKQRRLYDAVKKDRRYERNDDELDIYSPLTVQSKLRQVASGFIMVEGDVEEPEEFDEEAMNARLKALKEVISNGSGPMIIWASFKEEIRQILRMLAREYPEQVAVSYYGDTSEADRVAAVDALQSGQAGFFVASQAAGGTGLTLTAAERVAYFSNSFHLVERVQSEDRNHRIGTVRPVTYTDIVAIDTINERLVQLLQAKSRNAETVMEVLR